jgi:hypothetical protein
VLALLVIPALAGARLAGRAPIPVTPLGRRCSRSAMLLVSRTTF